MAHALVSVWLHETVSLSLTHYSWFLSYSIIAFRNIPVIISWHTLECVAKQLSAISYFLFIIFHFPLTARAAAHFFPRHTHISCGLSADCSGEEKNALNKNIKSPKEVNKKVTATRAINNNKNNKSNNNAKESKKNIQIFGYLNSCLMHNWRKEHASTEKQQEWRRTNKMMVLIVGSVAHTCIALNDFLRFFIVFS